MAGYADVIVDISLDKLDRSFQYRIPEDLREKVAPGVQVEIPFGNRRMTGYVIGLSDEAKIDRNRLRDILEVRDGSVVIESQLIALAWWMRSCYGSTMNQALRTVLPVSKKAKPVVHRTICLAVSTAEARVELARQEQRHGTARARLLRELLEEPRLDYDLVIHKLNVSTSVIRGMAQKGILTVETTTSFRNPISHLNSKGSPPPLNEGQRYVVDQILTAREPQPAAYLLKGVTGSGKTEVYMELIARILQEGRQAIVLIPEIALTYQTVKRFCSRFGDRVSIMNSRMSAGERYDQYLRAKTGDIDIMIGPRSALFTPFERLGMIIIDEEHESSYKSGTAPRYHARDTAIKRARMCGAKVVLGSATPSVDSYYQTRRGRFLLLELPKRVEEKPLPSCEIIDLRQELKDGNRSILSRRLQQLMEDRLRKGQQTMLFINRRGLNSFVNCRSCGHVIKCPHCDVSLSEHQGGQMICHYCGYRRPVPKNCPVCGSGYLAGFRAGTQKIEEITSRHFPDARILRMDYDTTRTKDSYEKILQSFANGEADILIGTQMIVKGHDFPRVTLVGVLAADLSLHSGDYRAAERTFQLLVQAVGRAGRGDQEGQAVIQAYTPDNYAVLAARDQDYERFYEQEITYRRLLHYPPVGHLLLLALSGSRQAELEQTAGEVAGWLGGRTDAGQVQIIGPADATVSKVKDVYRKVIYLKAPVYAALVRIRELLDEWLRADNPFPNVHIQYDFNPLSGF